MRRLALALVLVAGCGDTVTYTSFLVEAKLDPSTVNAALLARIGACAAIAETPQRQDSADLRCRQGFVSHDLGRFEYTTSLTSGTIKFIVVGNDFHQQTLVRGETTVDIVPSKAKVPTTVIAKGIPGVPENPNAPRDAGGAPPADATAGN